MILALRRAVTHTYHIYYEVPEQVVLLLLGPRALGVQG